MDANIVPLPTSTLQFDGYEETPQQAALADELDDAADQAFAEHDASMVEARHELQDASRLTQVAERLEDLTEIAGQINEATGTEASLVQVAMEMALAGTDVKLCHVFPSMESFVGGTISMESVGEVISAMWRKVMEIVKKALSRVVEYMKRVTSRVASLQRTAVRVAGRAKSLSGQTIKVDEFDPGRDAALLTIGSHPPRGYSDVEAALREISRQYDILMKNYPNMLLEAADDVSKAMDAISSNKPNEVARAMRDANNVMDVTDLSRKFGTVVNFADPRFEAGTAKVAKGIPGGWGFVFVGPGRDNSGLHWVRITDDESEETGDQMRTIPAQQVHVIATRVFDMLKTIQGVQFSNFFSKLESSINRVDQLGRRAMEDGSDNKAMATAKREVTQFMRTFTMAQLGPINQYFSHYLEVCRAALVVCNRSLDAHQGQ